MLLYELRVMNLGVFTETTPIIDELAAELVLPGLHVSTTITLLQDMLESWKSEAQMKRPGQPCEVGHSVLSKEGSLQL